MNSNTTSAGYESPIYSHDTIAEKLQIWADTMAILARGICILVVVVCLSLIIASIPAYKMYAHAGEAWESELIETRNVIIGSVAGLTFSVVGYVLAPLLFGWMYALGEYIQINRELLNVQKELLRISRKKDDE